MELIQCTFILIVLFFSSVHNKLWFNTSVVLYLYIIAIWYSYHFFSLIIKLFYKRTRKKVVLLFDLKIYINIDWFENVDHPKKFILNSIPIIITHLFLFDYSNIPIACYFPELNLRIVIWFFFVFLPHDLYIYFTVHFFFLFMSYKLTQKRVPFGEFFSIFFLLTFQRKKKCKKEVEHFRNFDL